MDIEENQPDDGKKKSTSFLDSWIGAPDGTSYSSLGRRFRLPPKYRLVTEDDPLKDSIWSLYFGVAVAAINTKMLNPNYPIMVSPGLHHRDSFESTEPFSFNSATYFIPMCSLLGVAIASVFLGKISDKVGRKRVFSILSWISGAGSITKYYTMNDFWAFCITNFVYGLFLGNLPVGMAYVGDVYTSRKEKQDTLGILVSYFVMGNSGGGMIAILMYGSGLFAPLWVSAGLTFISAIITDCYMIEPGDARLKPIGKDLLLQNAQQDDGDEDRARPTTTDSCTLWNIVAGALFDNFGSTGLFPMCLSPLALPVEQYMTDFLEAGLEPIPPEDLWVINRTRALERTPMIIPKVKPYSEDKNTLGELFVNAEETFEFRKIIHDRVLFEVSNPKREKSLVEICEILNAAKAGPTEAITESREALGHWVII